MNLPATRGLKMVNAAEEHLATILADLRWQDRLEWLAMSGAPVREGLMWSMARGLPLAAVTTKDETPISLVGVLRSEWAFGGEPEGTPTIWMLATNYAYNHVPHFAVITPMVLDLFHREFGPRIVAFVDIRNAVHHSWLDQMNFRTVDLLDRVGPFGLPFAKVERIAA